MKSISIILLCSSLLITACSDNKKATESNFKEALQSHHSKEDGKAYCVRLESIPLELTSNDRQVKMFDSLVDAGILTKVDGKVTVSGFGFGGEKDYPGFIYDVTDKGKQYVVVTGKGYGGSELKALCGGNERVKKIENFTTPSDQGMNGYTVSRVSYVYEVVDVPNWIKNPAVKEAFFSNVDFDGERKKNSILVLTDKGWIDQSDF